MPKLSSIRKSISKTSTNSAGQQTSNPNSSASTQQNKAEGRNWLNIINLILTAIIGIGGIVEALYLNNQNEQAQLKIVHLQYDLQSDAGFAHLQVKIGSSSY